MYAVVDGSLPLLDLCRICILDLVEQAPLPIGGHTSSHLQRCVGDIEQSETAVLTVSCYRANFAASRTEAQ